MTRSSSRNTSADQSISKYRCLADNYGNVVHLYDRDCSVQRRHQKVVEYAPAFSIPESTRQIIFDSAIKLCKQVGYQKCRYT